MASFVQPSCIIRSSPASARALASQHGCTSFRGAAAVPRRRRSPVAVAAAAAAEGGGKYPPWDSIFVELTRSQTVTLSPEEAFDAVELGRAVLVDCRPKEDFEKAHPRGAVHVPAFVVMESPSSPQEWAKWLACKANGVTCTVPNAELAAAVAAAASGGKAVVLACEAGGSLQPTVSFPTGKVSRSLKAAWKIVSSNGLPADRVQHLAGGVYGWFEAGLPMVGDYDVSAAGKTPNVTDVAR